MAVFTVAVDNATGLAVAVTHGATVSLVDGFSSYFPTPALTWTVSTVNRITGPPLVDVYVDDKKVVADVTLNYDAGSNVIGFTVTFENPKSGFVVVRGITADDDNDGFVFTQSTPALTWTIDVTGHFQTAPAVEVYVDGEVVLADVTISNDGAGVIQYVIVEFSEPATGQVVLS